MLVLGDSAPQHPRINGHRTNYLPREHVTTVRGIPVTTAERTLLDLAGVLPEHRLRRAVRQAQFLKLTTIGSLVATLHVPDLRWPRQRLVIEADGPHHDDPLARADDAERQVLLEAAGERVVRVTWEQAIAHPQATLGRIAGAGAPRAVD